MQKIVTLFIKRLLPVFVFVTAQIRVWALDSTTATTVDKSNNIFSQPWIWIGVVVIVAIKLLGPFTDDNKSFVVVRKKLNKKEST